MEDALSKGDESGMNSAFCGKLFRIGFAIRIATLGAMAIAASSDGGVPSPDADERQAAARQLFAINREDYGVAWGAVGEAFAGAAQGTRGRGTSGRLIEARGARLVLTV